MTLRTISTILAAIVILTSSFDVFLVIQAGGTFRFGQLVTLVLITLAVIRTAACGDVPMLAAAPLLAWWLVQVVFVPVTDFWAKSLAYSAWLLLDIALMFSFVQLFSGDGKTLSTLLRWYLYSFCIMSIAGIIQFLLPLAGLPAPFATEWLVWRRVVRVNGFSYEPSYYASYLLIGFVLAGTLIRSGLTGARTVRYLTALAIILSSSRMGISFLVIDIIWRQFEKCFTLVRTPALFLTAPLRLRRIIPLSTIFCLMGAGAFGAASLAKNNPALLALVLKGTGLFGAPAHSVVERQASFQDTLTVFSREPFIGRSIGGVSSAIADLHGQRITWFQESKPFEGMSVFAEVLAGSGLIGIVPFLAFLIITIYKPLKLARSSPPYYSVWLCALVRSLLFEWAILQFNQNILRPYLWVHLAVLVTVYAAARKLSLEPRRPPDGPALRHSPMRIVWPV
jgi:hypothetical protein